jgi:2,3,4,5-tetrahydropyridine-2-carboxylate N-succinyltransferase
MIQEVHSYAFGIGTKNSAGEIIEVFYPRPQIHPDKITVQRLIEISGLENTGYIELTEAQTDLVNRSFSEGVFIDQSEISEGISTANTTILMLQFEDTAPTSIPGAFLKLHLLSHRLAEPNKINLDGLFSVLKNIAWTDQGPVDLIDLPLRQLEARAQGKVLSVESVDKFPKMTDYVVPSGIRIADTSRVRLGAYIGSGTTVMHEGFVNFNAGTQGTAMVEGRISAGVIVANGSDLGGSSSTMGTLSGGGTELVSVGENCLIGANAGIGFPLADGCTIEAGLYVTAGMKVNMLNAEGDLVKITKAKDIRAEKNLIFRRNSLSGAIECIPDTGNMSLNEELHSHN